MTDRDCANCKHHTEGGCSSWDCEYEPKDLISRADAIEAVRKIVPYVIDKDTGQWGILVNKANVITELSALPSAETEPIVIRSRTLMPTKDFKAWAKRIKEENPNVIVIPCDAEVVSAVPQLKQTDTLIIADALRYLINDEERHELDRTRAEELREQILQYGASMCHSADAVSREEYEEVKAYMNTLVDAFIEDGKELAESVKVVRCKDCRYYNPLDDNKPYPCGYGMYMCNKDDYCSYGERRSNRGEEVNGFKSVGQAWNTSQERR